MSTFDNYHFTIDREGFRKAEAEGRYRHGGGSLSIREVAPAFDTFKNLLDRYGGPWGWNRRPKYLDEASVRARLAEAETRLLEFYDGDDRIGYCLIGGVKRSLKDRFWSASRGIEIAEIENIAIDKSLTGSRRGRFFLERVLRDLLSSYEAVYLSSRSTNHKGVPGFYLDMGMTLAHTEHDVPDDLVPVERTRAREPLRPMFSV